MSSLLILGGDIELNPGPNQQLKVALFNARSLVNKSASLEADVYSRNFDVIAVTEPILMIQSVRPNYFRRIIGSSGTIETAEEVVC